MIEETYDPQVTVRRPLTDREVIILEMAMEGLTSRETARRLFLAVGTVKAHRTAILGKLNAVSMTQAVAIYLGAVK